MSEMQRTVVYSVICGNYSTMQEDTEKTLPCILAYTPTPIPAAENVAKISHSRISQ